jgi:hypothetical protein
MSKIAVGAVPTRSKRAAIWCAVAFASLLGAAAWTAPQALAADIDLLSPGTTTFNGTTDTYEAGHAVAAAGDVNDDGLDDVIVGEPGAGNNGADSGSAYVIYGNPNRSSFALDNTLGARGFRIDGAQGIDAAGISVAGAGDVNGDQIDDVIVGATLANTNVNEGGGAYVVYGQDNPDPDNLNLADLEGADPLHRGFVIGTDTEAAVLGASVAGVGFFNSDSIADVAMGGLTDDATGTEAVYVVYGQDNAAFDDPADVNVDNLGFLEAARGMIITGEGTFIGVGQAIAGVGDTAGDNRTDIAIGAGEYDFIAEGRNDAGQVYIVYGENSLDPADVDLAQIYEPAGFDEDRGYAVVGAADDDKFGSSVAAVGDFNNQGRPDWIGGAPRWDLGVGDEEAGAAYIVTGVTVGVDDPSFDPDLADAEPLGGIWSRIDGVDGQDLLGTSVAGAGDVNGDGIPDAIVGAPAADPSSPGFFDGSAYVVYGQSAGDPADISAGAIRNNGGDDERGFALLRDDGMDAGTLGNAVATGGDVDGDGRSEVLVADETLLGSKGRVYIVESAAPVSLTPASHAFGELLVGEQSTTRQLTFTNTDNEGFLRIGPVTVVGADAASFALANNTCQNVILAPAESCTVDARFVPGGGGTKQASVRFADAGDGAPHDVALSGTGVFNPPDTTVAGPAQTDSNPTFTFSSPTAGATFECSLDLGVFVPCSSPLTLTNVAPGLHLLTVRAVANGLTDPSPAEHYFFVTGAGGPPPDPVQGETTNLEPVSGRVTVDVPNDGLGPIPIEQAVQVPIGTKVDTTKGRVELTSDKKGKGTQTAEFYAGVFVIRQGKQSDQTVARLRGAQQCGADAAKEPFAARKRKPKLWGNGSGNFASQGNHGTAAVRGTTWLLFESCGGITGTQVKKGVVAFRNHYTGQTTLVRAPGTAIAQPLPPASAK